MSAKTEESDNSLEPLLQVYYVFDAIKEIYLLFFLWILRIVFIEFMNQGFVAEVWSSEKSNFVEMGNTAWIPDHTEG